MDGPVVSLHPRLPGDVNLAWARGRRFTREERNLFSRARAILVPPAIQQEQYREVSRPGRPVFPNYQNRYGSEGKKGNLALFARFGLPHPPTWAYDSPGCLQQAFSSDPPSPWPVVIKTQEGGCGNGVFLARDFQGLEKIVLDLEQAGETGTLVAQKWINTLGQDLRVVVVAGRYYAYWRRQDDPGEFRNNVGKGARIEPAADDLKTRAGVGLAHLLVCRTGINFAAVDVFFDEAGPSPLLGEVNFFFGRRGLGGARRFDSLVQEAVREWIRLQ